MFSNWIIRIGLKGGVKIKNRGEFGNVPKRGGGLNAKIKKSEFQIQNFGNRGEFWQFFAARIGVSGADHKF